MKGDYMPKGHYIRTPKIREKDRINTLKQIKEKGNPFKGRHHSEESKVKSSNSRTGKCCGEENHNYGKDFSGENNPNYKGGKKLMCARRNNKRREKGFILLTKNNPYNEPIEYHHIDKNLPYVVPCPTRIHHMFGGREKNHIQNVNTMLNISIDRS